MSTKISQQSGGTRLRSQRSSAEEGMSPKKMGIIAIVTVVGCIAILWPKVFHPMMFGSVPPKTNYKNAQQHGGPGGKFNWLFDYRFLFLFIWFIILFIYRYCDRVFGVVCVRELGCCDVVLDREQFMNASKPTDEPYGPHLYRKQVNLYTGEISRWHQSAALKRISLSLSFLYVYWSCWGWLIRTFACIHMNCGCLWYKDNQTINVYECI